MPVHLRAYVYVMVLSAIVLYFLRRTFAPSVFSSEEFQRLRNLWLLMTSVVFLAGNFWVFAALCVLVTYTVGRKDSNALALYVFLLFVAPPLSRQLPGPGPIVSIMPLFHERLLTIAMLLPLGLRYFGERTTRPPAVRLADIAVFLFLAYQFLCGVFYFPFTGMLRQGVYLFLDIGLVYYVASRALHAREDARKVLGAFICAMAIMALVAMFESVKSWWVYDTISGIFGFRGAGYITRGDFGFLRAKASMGHPITLGYNIGVGLVLLFAFVGELSSRVKEGLLALLLGLGVIFSFSRGPWVGVAAGCLYLLFSGPHKARRFVTTVFLGALLVGVLSLSSFGRALFNMLPFVGTVDSGTILYRQILWEVSMVVWKQNFWFGDMNYLANPLMEQMRQGEGIIDMVNSYLQISLAYGLTGLLLFLLCANRAWRSVRPGRVEPRATGHYDAIPRTLRAALITVLVTIATVSSIELVPVTLWLLIGLCVGYGALAHPVAHGREQPAQAVADGPQGQQGNLQPPVIEAQLAVEEPDEGDDGEGADDDTEDGAVESEEEIHDRDDQPRADHVYAAHHAQPRRPAPGQPGGLGQAVAGGDQGQREHLQHAPRSDVAGVIQQPHDPVRARIQRARRQKIRGVARHADPAVQVPEPLLPVADGLAQHGKGDGGQQPLAGADRNRQQREGDGVEAENLGRGPATQQDPVGVRGQDAQRRGQHDPAAKGDDFARNPAVEPQPVGVTGKPRVGQPDVQERGREPAKDD